jgi:hypothetical protein
VQDACAALHESLGALSEFALDEARCDAARREMLAETARLEERIVAVYADAARAEEALVDRLRLLSGVADVPQSDAAVAHEPE